LPGGANGSLMRMKLSILFHDIAIAKCQLRLRSKNRLCAAVSLASKMSRNARPKFHVEYRGCQMDFRTAAQQCP
jgi:hypothetical protein